MVVSAMWRHSPHRVRKPRSVAPSNVLTAALVLLFVSTAAVSKDLPRSASGFAGPLSTNSRGNKNTGKSIGDRSSSKEKRGRLPTPASYSGRTSKGPDKSVKSRRETTTTTTTTTTGKKRDPSLTAAGSTSPRPTPPAAVSGALRPRPQKQQRKQQRPAMEMMSEQDSDSGSDFAFDIDSFDEDEYDSVWSDEGSSDDWSDEEEDDWGRGAAGGPGGGGGGGRKQGRGQARRAGAGGRGTMGAKSGAAGMGMSNWRDRLNKARQRASSAYREAKSLMSSEMEGVVLKATRPDDMPVKPKHLEALMRPTAEMPKEFNVYLPVVRKLWSKMADKEWRVSAKALYIVHRFAADGSIEHATNLKESVAVLRTHHDSRRKVNYFDMDTICDVKAPSWSGEDVAPMAEFLRGYADYVLRRTTQFGPDFRELLDTFAMLDGKGEIITAVEELVSAGSKCTQLRKEQEGAIAVAAALQVAQDVRDVMEVCAAQLEYLARELQAASVYPSEVERWYAFLYENRETVEGVIDRANVLAEKHKLAALRPLLATPVVLELRDEEMALKRKAALEAEQQQCAAEKQQQKPGERPSTDRTKDRRSTNEAPSDANKSSSGGGEAGGQTPVTEASVKERTQSARRRAESALPSDVAAPPAVAPEKTRSTAAVAKGREGTRPKSTSSPTRVGGSARKKKRITAWAASGEQRSTVRQPPESDAGTGAGAVAPHREDDAGGGGGGGATKKVWRGAGTTSAAIDGKVKSRVAKKKRSSSPASSSISKESEGGAERRKRPSMAKRETSAGGRGSSSSSRSGSLRPQQSAHKRKRQDTPSSGS